MAPKEMETKQNCQKRQALEILWEEIEKALLQSSAVRVSLTNYQAINSLSKSLKGKIILNIDKLTEMVKKDEESYLPSSQGEMS